jgi:hypothetical protein
VLLLAGAFEPVDEARAQQVKSDGVLVKPFEPQQVISRVRELIDGRGRSTPQTIETSPVMAAFEARTHQIEARAVNPESRPADYRSTMPDPRLPNPEPRVSRQEPPISTEDYFDFDRLDAAFARLGSDADIDEPIRPSRQLDDYGAGFDVPTVDSLLASAPLHDMPSAAVTRAPLPPAMAAGTHADVAPPAATPSAAIDSSTAGSGRNVIADVFSALFAAEQGEPDATPIRLAAPSAAPVVTDELVEEVTRRVLQRLAPNAAHDVVSRVVSEVAERLVREEIARIKSAVATRR